MENFLFVQYDTTKTEFKPAQNLSSGSAKKNCMVVIATTSGRQIYDSIARFMKVLFLFDCLIFSCHIYVLIESPLWAWLHVKELLTQKSMLSQILCFSNNILTQNHLVPKRLLNDLAIRTAQKMKFSSFLRMWLHFLKKSVMENFIFCAVPAIWLSVPLRTRWFVGSNSLQSFYFCF